MSQTDDHRFVQEFGDLVIVATATVAAAGLAVTGIGDGPLAYVRVALGLLFAFLLPGYAVTAALYPASNSADTMNRSMPTIGPIERIVLSVGLSLAVVPLVGLLWNFTPWGIGLVQVVSSIAGVTIVVALVAGYRRWQLASLYRFKIPLGTWVAGLYQAHRSERQLGRHLNLVIATLLLLSTAGIVAGITFPGQGEQYTELYVLTEDPETGNLTASGYPDRFVRGERKPLVVGVENHEHQTVNYTVVVVLQELDSGPDPQVSRSAELDRFELELAHDQTVQETRYVRPTLTGERLRLSYLLYRGEPPAQPTLNNAYRQVHLWIDVRSGE